MFAWYLNDELHSTDPRLLTHQQWAIEGDSDHPTWSVVTALNPNYVGTADAFGVDSYPTGLLGQNASSERGTIDRDETVVDGSRPIWQVIQVMSWVRAYTRYHSLTHVPHSCVVRDLTDALDAGSLSPS